MGDGYADAGAHRLVFWKFGVRCWSWSWTILELLARRLNLPCSGHRMLPSKDNRTARLDPTTLLRTSSISLSVPVARSSIGGFPGVESLTLFTDLVLDHTQSKMLIGRTCS